MTYRGEESTQGEEVVPRSRSPYIPSRRASLPMYTSPVFLAAAVFCAITIVRQVINISNYSFANHDAIRNEHLYPPWPIFAALGSVGLDMGDNQWRNFINNGKLLIPFLIVFIAISRFVRTLDEKTKSPTVLAQPIPALGNFYITKLAWFHAIAGLGFVAFMHGPRFFFMAVLILFNYFVLAPLSLKLPYRVWLALIWVFHIGILILNDRYRGYHFVSFFGSATRGLDSMSEMMPWNITFNMSTLRMIAYCIDFEEASHRGTSEMCSKLEEKHRGKCIECVSRRCACYKLRTDTPHPLPEYNLVHYIAYLFYVPLYIAGPMSSFNAYVSHLYIPQRWFGVRESAWYFRKIASCTLAIFAMLHFEHQHAIRLHAGVFEKAPINVKVSFFIQALGFLWLKFSIFWKFFRLVSLTDGFDVPEDMVRCFCATTTIANFWRDWHASFNQWIVRYMYIPMGGNRFKILSIFPIFGFIALWHDIEMKLFWWAAIMCGAFLPEAIGTAFFSQRKFSWLHNASYFPQVRCVASYVSVMSLILGNLVGYGMGAEKTGSSTEGALKEALTDTDVLMFILFPMCSNYITWRIKDAEYEADRRLKWENGLLDQEKDTNKVTAKRE